MDEVKRCKFFKTKKAKILFWTLTPTLLLLLLALIFITQSRTLFAGEACEDGAYAYTMSEVEGISRANPRVVDLAMLGAHDANTYNLDDNVGTSGEVGGGLKTVYALSYGLAYRYTKTQVSDIYTQLLQGVRFLNFKCSFFDGKWYGSHSLIDGPMEIYVRDAIRFMQETPGEIVVLDFNMIYAEDVTLSGFLEKLFSIEYNGQTLLDYIPYENIPLGELSYNDVTSGGEQSGAVIVFCFSGNLGWEFFDAEESKYCGKIYCGEGVLSSEWYNRMSTSALAEAIGEQCKVMAEEPELYWNGFRVMQMQTSPTAKDLFETAGAWSLVCAAKSHNPEMLKRPEFDGWMRTMPVVMCDFTTSASEDFNKNVNEKIAAYNRALVSALLAASS